MPRTKVNGISLYYEIHGDGDPLVMITGHGGSIEDWLGVPPFPNTVEDLSQFFKVIVYDNRGSGRSDKPDTEYSIKMMADDLAGLMKAIKVPKAHILGFSMGGMIAQELAINYPDKVSTLILISTTCGGSKTNSLKSVNDEVVETILSSLTDEKLWELDWKGLYTPTFIEKYRKQLLERVTSKKHSTPRFSLKRHSQAVLGMDTYERLPKIKVPTLILAGEDDPIISSDDSKFLAERIPNAQLKIFKGFRHGFFREIWHQTLTEITSFLSKNFGTSIGTRKMT